MRRGRTPRGPEPVARGAIAGQPWWELLRAAESMSPRWNIFGPNDGRWRGVDPTGLRHRNRRLMLLKIPYPPTMTPCGTIVFDNRTTFRHRQPQDCHLLLEQAAHLRRTQRADAWRPSPAHAERDFLSRITHFIHLSCERAARPGPLLGRGPSPVSPTSPLRRIRRSGQLVTPLLLAI